MFVSFERISFAYDHRLILKDISLRAKSGQLVVIMGGSGSGKTTLLRLISGQIRANSGFLTLGHQNVTHYQASDWKVLRRDMGVLFQFGALFTDLSVFDNVAFPLREHTKLPESLIRYMVQMKLHAVGLRGSDALMPSELSGGMARRVALARALALDPKLMLYDEPFTGLDPLSLSTIAQLIRRLQKALKMTVLLVSHDVKVSLEIADYVYLLKDGQVYTHGAPELLMSSSDAWVQDFLQGRAEHGVSSYFSKSSYAEDLGIPINLSNETC